MASQTDQTEQAADVMQTFLAVHQAFRRDAAVYVTAVVEADASDHDAFGRMQDCFTLTSDLLDVHHRAEEGEWAEIVERVPSFADDAAGLCDDHVELSTLLDSVSEGFAALARAGCPRPEEAKKRLEADVAGLRDLLDRHLAEEEATYVPALLSAFTEAELRANGKKHQKEYGWSRITRVVPWGLSAADPRQRARLQAGMPLLMKVLHRFFWARRFERDYPLLAGRTGSASTTPAPR